MPIPIVRKFLRRGVARALPPRVLWAAPERIPCGRIGSVGLGRDFQNQSLGMGLFLVRLFEGGLPLAGPVCGPPGAGWQQVSCTGCARQKRSHTTLSRVVCWRRGSHRCCSQIETPAFELQYLIIEVGREWLQRHFDLGVDVHFKVLRGLCRRGSVRWLHGAPPCKTFSQARRTDAQARSRILRSEEILEGFAPQLRIVKEANLLASRTARLARCIIYSWRTVPH